MIDHITVVRTNKGRTNKGQITFFWKIYWGLIRDKFLEKFPTKQNIADFLFRLTIFGEKLTLQTFWCEGLGSFLKRTFGGDGKLEINRWSNISLISLQIQINTPFRLKILNA